MRTFILATALITLSVAVFAQEDPGTVELTDPHANVAVLGITVEQAVGSEVIDTEGRPLGTVVRVQGDDWDSPNSLVLEANGREFIVELTATELINNKIVANRSGKPIEFKAPFE